jgi:hypothetical protein
MWCSTPIELEAAHARPEFPRVGLQHGEGRGRLDRRHVLGARRQQHPHDASGAAPDVGDPLAGDAFGRQQRPKDVLQQLQ